MKKYILERLYLHTSWESMNDRGKRLGLKKIPLSKFSNSGSEVTVLCKIDEETGEVLVTELNHVPLERPVRI